MELERLLAFFPPILFCEHGYPIAWFCLGASEAGWEACYVNYEGEIVNNLKAEGCKPLDALRELYALTRIIDLLRRPTIQVNEATGRFDNEELHQ